MALSSYEMALMVIGMVLSIIAFSFVFFGATPYFGFVEHLYIGGVTATTIMLTLQSIKTSAIDFILTGRVLLIVPVIIGVFAFLRLTRYRWGSRYTTSILTGVGIGITFGLTIRTWIMNALLEVINTTTNLQPDPLSAIIMLVITFNVFTYYLYSQKFSKIFNTGTFRHISTIGRYCLFASFGYLFGKIFVNEALDSLARYLVTYIYRTIVELQLFLST
jgi:hypothetical protein